MKHEMRVVSCFHWLFYRTLANSVGLKSLLTVCQFAAMICHLICFVVMLNKTRELQNKLGYNGACILYINAYDNGTNAAVEYNDVPCYFVTYGSLWLAAMAAYVTGFLIVRLVQVKRLVYSVWQHA